VGDHQIGGRRRAQQPRKTSARQAGRKEIARELRDLAAQRNLPL